MISGTGSRRHFSYDEALAVMREFNAGGITSGALADRHGVSRSVMRSMLNGITYRDIWLTVQRERGVIQDWQEPPTRKRPGPRNTPGFVLDELTALLKAHPGRWALVRTTQYRPNISWWQRRGIEAELRKIDGQWHVYARWPEGAVP